MKSWSKMEGMSSIQDNLRQVHDRLASAAQAAKRSVDEIKLLAVSKTFPADAVRLAYTAGQRVFGENYVQEGVDKILSLADIRSKLEWHFIGPLQSNKTQLVANHFDWVHSIDRLKIAQRLNDQRPTDMPPLQVCVQINISEESSKSGVTPSEAMDLCQLIQELPRLKLRGLMSIPEPKESIEQQRADHRMLKTIFQEIQKHRRSPDFDTLSMGMSSDMEAAILEGSTIVRIGTAIFGQRTYL